MKKTVLFVVALAFAWASWTCSITEGLSADGKLLALVGLANFLAIYAVARTKFPVWCNILIGPSFLLIAATVLAPIQHVSPEIRWVAGVCKLFGGKYGTWEKCMVASSIATLLIAIHFMTDCVIDKITRRVRKMNWAFSQLFVVLALAYSVWTIVYNGQFDNPYLTEASKKIEAARNAVAPMIMPAIRQVLKAEPLDALLKEKNRREEKYCKGQNESSSEGGKEIRPTERLSQKRPGIVDGCYTANFDVRTTEEISADDINYFLDGILAGKGELIIDKAKEHGINPVFLASIAIHEGDHGKSRISKAHNNPFGIFVGKECKTPKNFEDAESAIEYTAERLANSSLYVKGGKCTVGAIQKVYCPVGAANDPKKLNGDWLPGVLGWMNKIHKRSEASERLQELAAK